ncbi:serine/threonine-protein kinase [Leifsonia sp. AG29]|uniref:serine/threonine-protein kinase n=1 Tax=Leifsonia sp. AG29 TaxID=2598860 RepID=UPI00131E3C25|nr:serine/threonine-protein kinase [Leifsonia sp. AG29]
MGGTQTDGDATGVSHRSGDVIADRYRIADRIGSGGMAEVYRAHDEALGRDVALKIFRRELASADDLKRQQGEVQLLARLSHPSLVTLFDAISDDGGRGILVLEFVDGTDAGARMKQGALPVPAVAAIGVDIARALSYIHAQGVVHRDISPANILLPRSEESGVAAKLTDLGIARLVDDARITATGSVIGTASYMSPEQAQGRPLTPASDVYSFGLVLLECVTGKREFPGTAVESAIARLSRDPQVPDDVTPALRRLLQAMTARDAESRPAAAEVAERLSAILRDPEPTLPLDSGLTETVAMAPAVSPDDEPGHTRLLPSGEEPVTDATVVLPGAEPARSAPALPEAPRPARRRLSRAGARLILVIDAIVAGAAIVAVVLSLSAGGTSRPDPVTSYPSVSGTLGDQLKQLEHEVSRSTQP